MVAETNFLSLVVFLVLYSGLTAQNTDREKEYTSPQEIDPAKNSLLTRCFDRWGCFSIGEPYFSSLRPVSLFPVHPESLDVQFLLATRSAPDAFQKIRPGKNSTFAQSDFDPQKPIKMILHGFRESGYQDWIKELVREFLTADDYNVISVDWRQGASQPYPQAVANTRGLAMVISDFIDYIQRRYRISPANMHIIGYNLGAHAAGYVGKQVPRLGRITGLDPAGPYFENTERRVRLDLTDATFVDVIHSEGSASSTVPGMIQAIGHVDFYPTPGWRSARCSGFSGGFPDTRFGQCPEVTAPELFTESVNMDCPFFGYICDSYGNFSTGQCSEGCGTDMSKCASLGFKSDEWIRFTSYEPVSMFLETGREEPYCKHHYHIAVLISGNDDTRRSMNESGLLFIKLTGTKGRTSLIQATPGFSYFIPGEYFDFLVTAPNLGRLLRIDVLWSASPGGHPHPYINEIPQIHINRIRIANLETGYREVFCGQEEPINPEQVRVFFRGGNC